mgnify:CR=1 FL=1
MVSMPTCKPKHKTQTPSRNWIGRSIMLVFLILGLNSGSLATTLASMTIDEVSGDAELIFEGEVLIHEARIDLSTDMIYTFVTFAVHDVIKGDFSESELELRFSGGSLNGEVLEVTGLTLPEVGEQGIYFIESLSRNLINPLLGWSQGHYLIEDSGNERVVRTLDRHPITAVQPMANIPNTIRRSQRLIEGSADSADGIVSDRSTESMDEALSVDEFKAAIRELVSQ